MKIIECDRVYSRHKSATGIPILNGISCQIKAGEFVALLGLNGAGKSSLLKAMLGLMPLSQGEIRVNDILLTPRTLTQIRRQVRMIFQGGGLVQQLSALDNVLCGTLGSQSFWQTLWGFSPSLRRLALELLEQLGVKQQANQKVSKLSGGQKQRVAIARALIDSPKIILADEPIAGLDVVAAQQVMNSLACLHREQGLTIITVLHDLAMATTYAERAIILSEGQVVYDGTTCNLQAQFNQYLPNNFGSYWISDSSSVSQLGK
jgi:phosphonate transport system ATP-binding protein